MVVNVEFFDDEPIENLITCIHFKVSKLIFFCFEKVEEKQRLNTENFAKKTCGVQDVKFVELPENNLSEIVEKMRATINDEILTGNDVYFDVTGGKSQVLIAFGMIANEFRRPIHMYDIEADTLLEYDDAAFSKISIEVEKNNVRLDLDKVIAMHGGKLYEPGKEGDMPAYSIQNNRREQGIPGTVPNEEFLGDINKIWKVQNRYKDYWNAFSEFMREHLIPNNRMEVRERKDTIRKALAESKSNFNSVALLEEMLEALNDEGIIKEYISFGDIYSYWFKSEELKNCIWKSGSIFEYIVYEREKVSADDCRVSINLDWDGKLKGEEGNENDVYNEVDVISLKGNVPTFISCKSGNYDPKAFYELDIITKRLGGKYAKKKIATVKDMSKNYKDRAKEMGIEPMVVKD